MLPSKTNPNATPNRMPYAILRTAKLTKIGNIAASSSHNFRERQTDNADPERTILNRTTGAQNTAEVIEAIKSRLQTVPTVRKNGVLAVEYFIGASPEFFTDKAKTEQYFDLAEKWLIDRHGKENVISVTRQYDETSPHICAYVVPIDSRGRLNCVNFLGGRAKLNQMQTQFAKVAGAPVGLMRGIEGSKAKHTTIKSFYEQLKAILPSLDQPINDDFIEEPTAVQKWATAMGIDNDYSRAVTNRDVSRKKRAAEQREAEHAKAVKYEMQKAANIARDARVLEMRATASQVRQLPLHQVLEHLGCHRDKKDPKNWRTPAGRISIDGPKFYVHDIGKGGGGAIDLVMLIESTDYEGAVNRLAQHFGLEATEATAFAELRPVIEAAAKAAPTPYTAPVPVPKNWARVRQYLTVVRGLSSASIDHLHGLGRIYADRFSNAVFTLGKGIGVELRGTGDTAFHGTRGKKGLFSMRQAIEKRVAFVESAIDAISLRDLGFDGRIVSTGGNSNLRVLADKCRDEGLAIIAAFDNDAAGNQMAKLLGEHERLVPIGKDWNDDLIKMKGAKMATTPTQADRDLVADFEALRRLNPDTSAPLEVTRAVDRILVEQAKERLKAAEQDEDNAAPGM